MLPGLVPEGVLDTAQEEVLGSLGGKGDILERDGESPAYPSSSPSLVEALALPHFLVAACRQKPQTMI